MPRPSPRRLHSALLAVTLLCLTAGAAQAQLMASERGRVWQMISGTEIEVDYARPSVRGRSPVFGGIVPWGEVWTPGANDNTTLRISKPIEINGVEIPAGKYGLWMEVLEDRAWTLVVHADTTLFHTQHPQVSDGLFAIPVEPTESPDFLETLTFTIEAVRPSRAELRLSWGDVRVSMKLGIDPGVETVVAPEAASALAGEWLYDDTPSLPSEEMVEQWLAGGSSEEETEEIRSYLDGLRALQRPRRIRFEYDAGTGSVTVVDEAMDAFFATLAPGGEEGSGDAYSQILVPRGQGTYAVGFAIAGELAEFDPQSSPLIEFELDGEARAVRFTWRDFKDEIQGTGLRPGA